MEKDQIIHTIQRNPEEEIRIALRDYNDRRYFDLRLWFMPSRGGEYRPTKKGITLPIEYLEEVKTGLEKARKTGQEMPLHHNSRPIKCKEFQNAEG